MALLQQAVRLASRQVAPCAALPKVIAPQVRAFGAVAPHKPATEIARPFKGASPSEPEMEYIAEPSMTYMTCLMAFPLIIQFWFLTKFT
mmetsp:Transcript_8459/g.13521  ORF Transcript_8459/g.13521 Transcript_8459/m.13521 type:complete len:89 (-) Transcript_8459:8-274(-)